MYKLSSLEDLESQNKLRISFDQIFDISLNIQFNPLYYTMVTIVLYTIYIQQKARDSEPKNSLTMFLSLALNSLFYFMCLSGKPVLGFDPTPVRGKGQRSSSPSSSVRFSFTRALLTLCADKWLVKTDTFQKNKYFLLVYGISFQILYCNMLPQLSMKNGEKWKLLDWFYPKEIRFPR